jgi:hypothetical protein
MNKRVIILEPSSKVTNAQFKAMLDHTIAWSQIMVVYPDTKSRWDVHIAIAQVTYEKSKSKARNR